MWKDPSYRLFHSIRLSKIDKYKDKKRKMTKVSKPYLTKEGQIIILDSSWEFCLAERFDKLNILWIRPNKISYIDNLEKNRFYFPDFYLPEYDLYIDTKNLYVQFKQKEKLEILQKLLPNLIILNNKKDILNYIPKGL
jgi:hypothetical protein